MQNLNEVPFRVSSRNTPSFALHTFVTTHRLHGNLDSVPGSHFVFALWHRSHAGRCFGFALEGEALEAELEEEVLEGELGEALNEGVLEEALEEEVLGAQLETVLEEVSEQALEEVFEEEVLAFERRRLLRPRAGD